MKNSVLRRRSLLAFAFVVIMIAGLRGAMADDPATAPATQPAHGGDRFTGKQAVEGLTVHDPAEADVKLALARHMELAKEWTKAANAYQEVITGYSDRLAPSELNADGEIFQYTNFGRLLQDRLSHWPREGLDQYCARFEGDAKLLLDSAGPDDSATLAKVVALYFCTDSAKQAALRMIDLDMENGEYSAAAMIGDRLLSLHPNLQGDRPAVLYRTGLAWFHAGNPHQAGAWLDELKQQFPHELGTIRGKEVVLADSLASEMAAKPGDSPQPSPDSWPMLGGDVAHGRISTAASFPVRRLYDIPVDTPDWKDAQPPGGVRTYAFERLLSGRSIGILPVVDNGELFFQDGHHVFGVDLATGAPLPGWSRTYPAGKYTLAGVMDSARGHQLSLTLTGNHVLAIMAHPDEEAQDEMKDSMKNGGVPRMYTGEARLVCLDRASGAQEWTIAPRKLPETAKIARSLALTGSPMVVGQTVLVIALGFEPGLQLQECCVLGFDLKTGAFRWSAFVAAQTPLLLGRYNSRSIPAETAEITSHLAYADGRVYVQSNLGALAALDPNTGTVSWLDIFPIGRQQPKNQPVDPFWGFRRPRPVDHKAWSFNPVIAQGGRIFTLPAEGDYLHVVDGLTGREINAINVLQILKIASDPGSKEWINRSSRFDTIVGIFGDNIVLASERSLIRFNWKKYKETRAEPFDGAITQWTAVMPTELRGRAFMSGDAILVPCQDRLYRLSADTGKTIATYPADGAADGPTWKDPQEPGNVLATNDAVIIAGAKRVTVYADHPLPAEEKKAE